MRRVLMILGTFGLLACDQSGTDSTTSSIQSATISSTNSIMREFHHLTPNLLVGPRPSREQIEELSAFGIQKVISVDALPPESSLWGKSIRVRHLPLSYRELPKTLQLRLARELTTDGVKTYVHCHHGKHRGPAAALAALRTLDQLDQAEATVWLDRCGVEYKGLRDAVQNARPESSDDILAALPLEEIAATRSLSRMMAEIDQVWDRLKKVPSPDDPIAKTQIEDASHLVDLFRLSSKSAGPVDPAYPKQMREAVDLATALENQLQLGLDTTQLRADLRASCRTCHKAFRN